MSLSNPSWLVVWNMKFTFSIQLGMESSSQFFRTLIFFRGLETSTTNQSRRCFVAGLESTQGGFSPPLTRNWGYRWPVAGWPVGRVVQEDDGYEDRAPVGSDVERESARIGTGAKMSEQWNYDHLAMAQWLRVPNDPQEWSYLVGNHLFGVSIISSHTHSSMKTHIFEVISIPSCRWLFWTVIQTKHQYVHTNHFEIIPTIHFFLLCPAEHQKTPPGSSARTQHLWHLAWQRWSAQRSTTWASACRMKIFIDHILIGGLEPDFYFPIDWE